MDIKAATTDQLFAAERYASWKPAELRAQANELEAGTHIMAASLPAEAIAPTVAAMRAEADQIDADAMAATAEIKLRRDSLRAFSGHVS